MYVGGKRNVLLAPHFLSAIKLSRIIMNNNEKQVKKDENDQLL